MTAEKCGYYLPLKAATNTVGKEQRIEQGLQARLEAGHIVFGKGEMQDLLIDQLLQFPDGEHDDGPDALEGAVRMATSWLRRAQYGAPRAGGVRMPKCATWNISNRIAAPKEAVRYLKRKRVVETDSWNDLSSHEHAHAFAVAHSAGAGILDDTFAMLQEYQKQGTSFEEFKKDYLALMHKKGWYGRKDKNADDTKYINWRTKLLFDTNMRTAQAAGAYRQQLRSAFLLPWWVYKSKWQGEARRANHKVLHNVAYRHDDVFWDTHYPPNGWGCQCYVVAMDDDDLEEYGVRKGDADADLVNVPEEWMHNPGQEAFVPRFGDMKYISERPELVRDILRAYREDLKDSVLTTGEFAQLAKKMREYDSSVAMPNVPVVLGIMDARLHEAIAKVLPEVDVKLMGTTKAVAHALREGKVGDGGYRPIPEDTYVAVLKVISKPDVVYRDGSEYVFAKQLDADSMRVVFGRQGNHPLQLRTIDYFRDNTAIREADNSKEGVYEK